jgi:tRNA(Leu) C34 or U34 (ribose-2'-O)-methylase TrmL
MEVNKFMTPWCSEKLFELKNSAPISKNILDYEFELNQRISILTGNESYGVPAEIIMNSDCLVIPNPGYGGCMNTAQAANVALYEYVRQQMRPR